MSFRDDLRDLLLTLPHAHMTHGQKQVDFRCFSCGDSSDPRHTHMTATIYDENMPCTVHCFRCGYASIINEEVLSNLGLFPRNPNFYSNLLVYNKNKAKMKGNKQFDNSIVYKLNNVFINDNKLSRIKLDYINRRLGLKLTYNDLLDNKIVLNLNDLLSTNYIIKLTRSEFIVDQLNKFFIGFLSEDNAFINMRTIIKESKRNVLHESIRRRYTQYSIFNKFDNTRNNYTIPTDIDILSPNKIRINIAEGSFDILSVFYNLRNQDRFNCIYSSISGNNYAALCRHFIIGFGLINIEFHIYMDNDINMWKMKEVENLCRDLQIPFYLHRNLMKGEKDFGVPINRIKEQVQQIV